jgi:hypothetical protein
MDVSHKDTQKPPPLRSILTRPVLLSIANYAMLALIEMVCLALMPLMWSTPIEFGGLGMSPVAIGLWMSVYGCMDGIVQFTIFPRVVEYFGLRRVFVTCIAFAAVLLALFPLESLVIRHAVRSQIVWPLICLQLVSFSIVRMGYSKSSPILLENIDG